MTREYVVLQYVYQNSFEEAHLDATNQLHVICHTLKVLNCHHTTVHMEGDLSNRIFQSLMSTKFVFQSSHKVLSLFKFSGFENGCILSQPQYANITEKESHFLEQSQ